MSGLADLLRPRTAEMLDALHRLVDTDSPSSDSGALEACARVVCEIAEGALGSRAAVVRAGDRPHVRWTSGAAVRVLLLGHFDTVWPLGTTARWPFKLEGDRASGPGVFDMKSGLVQGLFAVAALSDPAGVDILLTSDEEIGAPTSRELIEESAAGAEAVLVLEPSHHGALKVARKGIATYTLHTTGLAAHAGLEPEKGVNALVELAAQVSDLTALARPEEGTTVTPTLAAAGTAINTVPAAAELKVDCRARTSEEMKRVDDAIRATTATIPGADVRVEARLFRAPLEARMSRELFDLAREIATNLGIGPLEGVEVGGASDGNLTAAMGIPTLDGLGAVGDGAHAEGEWVHVPSLADRTALVAELIARIRR